MLSQNTISVNPIFTSPTLTFIVGLPGSGKTTYALKNFKNCKIFDDVANNTQEYIKLIGTLNQRLESCVVTDSFLLTKEMRLDLQERFKIAYPLYNIVWILFENDPEYCIINIQKRNDLRIISENYIRGISAIYELDDISIIVPVHKPMLN